MTTMKYAASGGGDYEGWTSIAGGYGYPHIEMVYAFTSGEESCFFGSHMDWENWLRLSSEMALTMGVTVRGYGEYWTFGWLPDDCLIWQQIGWVSRWEWESHGVTRDGRAYICRHLRGSPNFCD